MNRPTEYLLDSISAFFAFLKVPPAALSLTGGLICLVSGIFVAKGDLFIGVVLYVTGCAFDAIDGRVSRRLNRASSAGAIIDSTMDRIGEFAYCAGLVVNFHSDAWFVTAGLLMIFGGFLVSYSSAKYEIHGFRPPRGIMRRPGRVFALFAVGTVAVMENNFPNVHQWQEGGLTPALLFAAAALSNISGVYRMCALYWKLLKLDRSRGRV